MHRPANDGVDFFIVFETLKLVSAAIFYSYGIRLLHVHNIHYVVHLYVVQLGAGGSANMAWCTSFLLCLYLCVFVLCLCVCSRATANGHADNGQRQRDTVHDSIATVAIAYLYVVLFANWYAILYVCNENCLDVTTGGAE